MKVSTSKLIIGIALILFSLPVIAGLFGHPPAILRFMVAEIFRAGVWVALGIFLVVSFFKDKGKEDTGEVAIIHSPNSKEDIDNLVSRRFSVIAWILLLEILFSAPTWISNDYAAGLVYKNVVAVFDILTNIGILYFTFQFFLKRDKFKSFVYFFAFTVIGMFVIDAWWGKWSEGVAGLLLLVYFVYYIKSPVSRRSYRIANFAILPAALILVTVISLATSAKIGKLEKKELQEEVEFSQASSKVFAKYSDLVREEDIGQYSVRIEELRRAVEIAEIRIETLDNDLASIDDYYRSQIGDGISEGDAVSKKLDKVRLTREVLDDYKRLNKQIYVLLEMADGFGGKVPAQNKIDQYSAQIYEISRIVLDIQELSSRLIKLDSTN